MKILGIGNAIVDVICKVEDSFLSKKNLTKSTMKLVDETEFKNLLYNLKIEETISGGSVANSIVGLSQLGNKVGFIGKVNEDELGNKYEEGLKKEKVEYFYSKKKEDLPTGTCLILITPDSERTMCTFLGTAGKINENDIDINAVKNSEIIFLEGYLWDEGDPKKAFDKAIQNSNKVAMSLSDLFCVERHKPHFLDLVKNKLNITFSNEQEILSLLDTKNFDEVVSFAKELGKLIVITRGEKGSIAINKNEVVEYDIQKNLKIVDLTGAGDLFAAGFLHGHVNNLSIKESLQKGTEMSARVIQKIGARL
jgi:fructokinase